MALPSAQQVAINWRNGMSNSSEKLKAGINAVTESPTAKAANNIDRMVAGVQRAAQSGKTAAALKRVTLEDWKQAMLSKGVSRVAAGAQQAQPKVQAFMEEFLPHIAAGQAKIASMPRGDLEANLARANEMARHTASFRRRM